MRLFSRRPKTSGPVTTDEPEFLSRVDARAALDKQEREAQQERMRRQITLSQAIDTARDAQEWLDTHKNTHSARKRDVKALIAAVANLTTLVDISDAQEWLDTHSTRTPVEEPTANERVADGNI
jgi:hypothetical protein